MDNTIETTVIKRKRKFTEIVALVTTAIILALSLQMACKEDGCKILLSLTLIVCLQTSLYTEKKSQ
jgi:hypothetical protein